MICSTNIHDWIKSLYVSFEDVTQFGINHLPVCCIMNVRDVASEGGSEGDNNYISSYRIIWNAEKV
jgi:hypothetical protein